MKGHNGWTFKLQLDKSIKLGILIVVSKFGSLMLASVCKKNGDFAYVEFNFWVLIAKHFSLWVLIFIFMTPSNCGHFFTQAELT